MRAFIVVCLLATAFADKLGYNYAPGLNAIDAAGSVGLVAPIPINTGGVLTSVTHGGPSIGSGIISTGIVNTGSSIGSTTIDAGALLNSVPQTVEYSKQFYHFTAPEEEHHEGVINHQLSNVLKKNLQVVFIKAPENNAATNAAVQLAKQAIEQRTAIYVLSKENDPAQVVTQLEQIQENVQTAPEVRIVKYRTPQDAAIATQQIQAQYNNAGGSSEVYNGGVAPVLNYASQPSIGIGGGLGTVGIGGGLGTVGIGGGISTVGIGSGLGTVGIGSGLGTVGIGGVGIGHSVLGGSGYGKVGVTNSINYLPPALK